MTSVSRVVVVAGSIEGIDALSRLINSLPATFPVPVVAHVHGLNTLSIDRLLRLNMDAPDVLEVVLPGVGQPVRAGCFHVAPEGHALVFTGVGIVDVVEPVLRSSADRLFESAAHWYQAGVVGVVLSGSGSDGTQGLRAITQVDGIRVVQSPSEASFTAMPMTALLGDSVEYSVLLDQLGGLLQGLGVPRKPAMQCRSERSKAENSTGTVVPIFESESDDLEALPARSFGQCAATPKHAGFAQRRPRGRPIPRFPRPAAGSLNGISGSSSTLTSQALEIGVSAQPRPDLQGSDHVGLGCDRLDGSSLASSPRSTRVAGHRYLSLG